MKQITSFEEACLALNISSQLPSFDAAPVKHQKALIAHYMLIIIVECINDGWQPDWSDGGQKKWELYPDLVEEPKNPSGFGLSYHVYDFWFTFTTVGSRLCFKSEDAAKHCFETFKQLWEDYFLIPKN
jgi:hypothetical protein